MNRILSFGAALALVLSCIGGRAVATEYNLTLIDYPGATETMAIGINDLGQIIGWYNDVVGAHGFTLSGGVYTTFDVPGAVHLGKGWGTGAYGLNSQGQIVGAYDASGGTVRGYIRDDDTYVDIVPFGSRASWARGINDNGTVVGIYRDAGGVERGFLFDGSNFTTLNDPGAVRTYPEEINNAGVIVGTGWESTGLPHVFLRGATGNFTDFTIDGIPGGAGGINDLGQIVGDYGPTPDDIWGFVLTGGVNATPDKLVVPGATVTSALDINNLGQVVGMYSMHGSWPDGPWRSFLATPIAAADFDRDGDVDGTDLIMWQGDYGLNANCDADGDGDTDGKDFLVWQRQYIAGVPGLARELGIPEPATLCLMLMALAGSVRAARNSF